jgi:hypothetical protein
MKPEVVYILDEEETPTTNVLAGFCVLMVVQEHADEDGRLELTEDQNAEDTQLTKWANEYLTSNSPIGTKGCTLLRGLAVECGLSEAELGGLMGLAEDGFGVMDIRMISLNAPILPGDAKAPKKRRRNFGQ